MFYYHLWIGLVLLSSIPWLYRDLVIKHKQQTLCFEKRERENSGYIYNHLYLYLYLYLSIYSYINTYTYTSWQRLRSFTRVVLIHLQFPISSTTTTKPLLNKTRFYPHLLPLLLHPIPVSLFLLVFSSFLFLFIPFLIFNVFCLRILLQFIFRLIQISMVIFFSSFFILLFLVVAFLF